MAGSEKPKILIVDDIEVNLILLETVLRKENATILKSTSGPEAIEISAVNELAIIILDVSMPGMNGIEVAEHIRLQENNLLTPIIFISAIMYDQRSIVQGYQAGAVDYLTKPFQNEVLLGKVRMFLKIHQQNREIQHTSLALKASVARYQKAEQTLLFRYQLERIVSLASARFSGKFDPDSSIQFMLIDLAQLLNANDASYFTIGDQKPGNLISSAGNASIEIPTPAGPFIQELFSKRDSSNILIHFLTLENHWYSPGKGLETGNDEKSVAIPVNLSEKPYGCILIRGCTELDLLEPQDIYSLGVFGTITGNALERAATRIALEKSELKYRSYIENAPNGILVVDASGKILESNAVSTLLFGLSAYEIQLRSLNELLDPEKLSGQFPKFTGLIYGERNQGEFIVTIGKSNLIIRAESVRLPDGNYLIFCSDITATRDMEKHLIHTERMVGIGEMATGIAHEINQPLNTISFGIDNLMHAISSKQADENYIKEKSRKIFEGIHRMRTIIDHVRTFSRSNDDCINSIFSLNESITNALSLVNEQFKNQGIEISTKFAPDQDVSINGNTYKIEQVILNLLSNSRDALEEKMQLIKVPFTQTIEISSSGNQEKIEIKVSDNGNGIPSEHLEHITAPFYTTKEPGKGTGLGLAISYGIIREHDGEINFSSEPGNGTTVSLIFHRNLKTADK